MISAARLRAASPAVMAASGIAAVLLGVGIALSPVVLLVPAGLAAAVVLVIKPKMGVAALWITGLFYGVLLRAAGGDTTKLLWKDLLLLALLGRTLLTDRVWPRLRSVPLWPLAVWGVLALLSLGLVSESHWVGVLGLRATFEWVLIVFVSAAWIDADDLRKGLTWLLPVLLVVVGVAFWQSRSSVEGLLSQGYEYFANLRHAGPFLRAPGTLTYHGPFAHTMAILALAYLAMALSPLTRRVRLAASAGALLALAGAALALSRSALIGSVPALIVLVRLLRTRQPLPRRGAIAVPALLFAAFVVAILAVRGGEFLVSAASGKDPSVSARLEAWSFHLSHADLLRGGGPGSVGGVAAASVFRRGGSLQAAAPYLIDNYYLTTLLQYGIAGLVLLLAFLLALGKRLVEGRPTRTGALWLFAAGPAVLTFLIAAMVAQNLWDDFPTPIFAWTVIGAAAANARNRREAMGEAHR